MDSWHFPVACSLQPYYKAMSLEEEENGQGLHGPKERVEVEADLFYQTVLGSSDLIFIQKGKR